MAMEDIIFRCVISENKKFYFIFRMVIKLNDMVIITIDGKQIEAEVLDVSSESLLVCWVDSNTKNFCSVLKKNVILHKPKKNFFFKCNNFCYLLIILLSLFAFCIIFLFKKIEVKAEKRPANIFNFCLVNIKNAFGFINNDD